MRADRRVWAVSSPPCLSRAGTVALVSLPGSLKKVAVVTMGMKRMMRLLVLQMVWKQSWDKFNFAMLLKYCLYTESKVGKNHILKRFPGKTSLYFASVGKGS